MKAKAFELDRPMPILRESLALAVMIPWINVGEAGKLALSVLTRHFAAREIGRLSKPGKFFDFTRYRPLITISGGQNRDLTLPNSQVYCAAENVGRNDIVFLNCLEPHMNGEEYVESVLKTLEVCDVRLYCTIGAMLDSQPHTRPLIITGRASSVQNRRRLTKLGIRRSDYQGPTSILSQIATRAQERGIETMSLIVHVPCYLNLDEDYRATHTLLGALCSLFQFSIDLDRLKQKGERQYEDVGHSIEEMPQLRQVVEALEAKYDQETRQSQPPGTDRLSPQIERFLKDLERRR